MIIIIISFIDNLALFYLSLDGTLFPDVVYWLEETWYLRPAPRRAF